jgi:nucleotide-binding universal stress UspA family protein
MYRRILVPIAFDHDRDSDSAVEVARALLAEGGTITALHVMEDLPGYIAQLIPEGQREQQRDDIAAHLREAIGEAWNTDVAVIVGHSGRSIVDYAEQNGVDCIIVASHRPGLQDYLLGSTAARIVRHAPCAVHVIR